MRRYSTAAIIILLFCTAILGAQCSHEWRDDFWREGSSAHLVTRVFDDGTGPMIYAAGTQQIFGGIPARHIARSNGRYWSAVGAGLGSTLPGIQVRALEVFDFGAGPELVAGGSFLDSGGTPMLNVARWNGTSWQPIGAGLAGQVNALAVFDDGGGARLYAAGAFPGRIARWNGTAWIAMTSAPNVAPTALVAFNDGGTNKLVAGGPFVSVGGVTMPYLAAWNGTTWAPLGAPFAVSNASLFMTMKVADLGAGPELFAALRLATTGSTFIHGLARYSNGVWTDLALPFAFQDATPTVVDIEAFDPGTGPSLYVGGMWRDQDFNFTNWVWRYDGSTWIRMFPTATMSVGTVPSSSVPLGHLDVFNEGSGQGPRLYYHGREPMFVGDGIGGWERRVAKGIGPTFAMVAHETGTGPILHIAAEQRIWRWVDGRFELLNYYGQGVEGFMALASVDLGAGAQLFAGGDVIGGSGSFTSYLVRYDGASATAVGTGVNGPVRSLVGGSLGGGMNLFAGGDFTTAGGAPAAHVASWNGSNWTPLGAGVNGPVYALALFDDGLGAKVYAGGAFTSAGGQPANGLAVWNGSSWTPAPFGGLARANGSAGVVYALHGRVENGQPVLYVGGSFASAGGVAAPNVARLANAQWSGIGPPSAPGADGDVYALTSFDDGRGDALYVGGGFTTLAGLNARGVARYDGHSFETLGDGLTSSSPLGPAPAAGSMIAFDGGFGPSLWVGGIFDTVNHIPSTGIAVWNRDLTAPGCGALGIAAAGTVGGSVGGPFDVLRVNGSAGNADRRVNVGIGQPLTLTMDQPSTTSFPSGYVLYGFTGIPTAGDAFALPFGIGTLLFAPPPLAPQDGRLVTITDNLGVGGSSPLAGTGPTPSGIAVAGGIPYPITLTMQGVIIDASQPYSLAVTNGVLLVAN